MSIAGVGGLKTLLMMVVIVRNVRNDGSWLSAVENDKVVTNNILKKVHLF